MILRLFPADAVTQQLLMTNKEVPPKDQDQEDPEPPHIREEQEEDLDEADIIQFTYNPRRAERPGQDVDPSDAGTARAQPGPAVPDQDVQLVSSETEDSDDYSKEAIDTRSASNQLKPKRICRPGAAFCCRICGRTFKARRLLFRHVKAHLPDVEPVCSLCGERFESAENLKLHIQTHRTTQRRKRELENQNRTQSGERQFRQWLQPDTNASEKPHTCDDCGKTFQQVWKKKRHRCHPGRKKHQSRGGTAQSKTT